MKRSLYFLSVILVASFLSGCIISKTPETNDLAMTLGDITTFSMKVFPSNAVYTWTLDGVELPDTEWSYIYTAEAGDHTLTVKAKHVFGTDTQTWNMTVNSPPVASAAINSSIVVFGGKAILDGAASYDPDGSDLTYAWTVIMKPSGSTAALSSDTDVSPTFIPDKEGRYMFSLVVSDGELFSKASKVTLDTFDGSFESCISAPWAITVADNVEYSFPSDYVHGGFLSFKPDAKMGHDNDNKLVLSFPFPKPTYVYSISAWMYRKGSASSAVHSRLYVDGTLMLNGTPAPRDPHGIDGKYHILDPKDPNVWVQRTWAVNALVSTINFVYDDLFIIDNIYLDDIVINTWGD
jgi:hypothetical protein